MKEETKRNHLLILDKVEERSGFYVVQDNSKQTTITLIPHGDVEIDYAKGLEGTVAGAGEFFVYKERKQITFRDHNYGFGAPPIDMLKGLATLVKNFYISKGIPVEKQNLRKRETGKQVANTSTFNFGALLGR